MTKIINKANTIKTEAMGEQWRGILTQKWQLANQMSQVDPKIVRVLVTKCRGNPLLCLQYFVNMI